jgi:hypothetical protein
MAQKAPFQNHRYAPNPFCARDRLLSRIFNSLHTSIESLAGQLGEYFQIRDDYKNLTEEVRESLAS